MPTEGERIAVLENEMKNVTGALRTLTDEVKNGFKAMDASFVRQKDFDDYRKKTENEFIKLEQRRAFNSFLVPTMAAVAGSVLTFLIIEYLRTR